jgi:hypothetical protein
MNTFIVRYLTSIYLSTGLWYEKYDTYGKVCTEMFLVNVRSMHVLHGVVDAELMQFN